MFSFFRWTTMSGVDVEALCQFRLTEYQAQTRRNPGLEYIPEYGGRAALPRTDKWIFILLISLAPMCRVGTAKVETRRVLAGRKTRSVLQIPMECVLGSIPMRSNPQELSPHNICVILHHRDRRGDGSGHGTTLNKEYPIPDFIHDRTNTARSCYTGLTRSGEMLMRRGPPRRLGPKERSAFGSAVCTPSIRYDLLTDHHRPSFVLLLQLPNTILAGHQRTSPSALDGRELSTSILPISTKCSLKRDRGTDPRARDIREIYWPSVPQCARSKDSVRDQKDRGIVAPAAAVTGQNAYGKSTHRRGVKHKQHEEHFTIL